MNVTPVVRALVRDATDAEVAFGRALIAASLAPHGGEMIFADGRLHRYRLHDDRPGRRNGWAVLHVDGVAYGIAGSWRTAKRMVWTSSDGRRVSAVERARLVEVRRRYEIERATKAAAVALKANGLFGRLPPAPVDHPYLTRKCVMPGPCRVTRNGVLVLPVRNARSDSIMSLQFIRPDGEKRFLYGGAVAGGCCVLGDLADDLPIAIAEGYATVASIHTATGWPVVAAFSADNLGAVAKMMRERFPERDLVLCADNDKATSGNPGLKKATEAACAVKAQLAVPPEAGDFNDLATAKGVDAVRTIVTASGEVAKENDNEAVARLAKLQPMEYDRVREAEAKKLGVRAGTLDGMVRRARGGGEDDETAECEMFSHLEPWPGSVDGAALLDALSSIFSRHVVLPTGSADAAALWVLHAHAHESAAISPILAIVSPTPECGKTTFLTVLAALVPRPLPASNITAAALFRAVEKWRPTLMVDEADTFLRGSDELRGVINSGHNRAAAYVVRTVGEDHEPRRFATWSPKSIALIGKLPATLASRSIHVELRRLGPGECIEPVRADRLDHLQPFARKAARWAADHDPKLRGADPVMPPTLTGRRADNWRHLIAIADAAGSSWPLRARKAAEALTAVDASQTAGIMLLEDIRARFAELQADRMPSADLAEALACLESRPWPEWSSGKPITPRQIARLLEPFGIKSQDLRLANGRTGIKGYRLDQFADAFPRYLADVSATALHPTESAISGDFSSATPKKPVADRDSSKFAESLDCSAVADREPETWGDEA